MAATVDPIENIRGAAGGIHNLVVYTGPTYDLDTDEWGVFSSDYVLKVIRLDDLGEWVPDGVGNDFTTLDGGYGGVNGRGYLIVAVQDFTLPHCVPAEQSGINTVDVDRP
jgi:hypothetical protein